MEPVTELLPNSRIWLRVSPVGHANPVDPTFAGKHGGRWNPPHSFPALYLNGDAVTARLNMLLFTSDWPYEPEDLRPDAGPLLHSVTLPRGQTVADAHTSAGVEALGLPKTYPLDRDGKRVGHDTCQSIGQAVKDLKLRGVHCRGATAPRGESRELAWFPASKASKATVTESERFDDWYYA